MATTGRSWVGYWRITGSVDRRQSFTRDTTQLSTKMEIVDLHHETVGEAEYVPFEGRMVTPAARDAALEFRRRPSVRGSHVTGATPEEKAEAILAASHQEFLREKRQRERDEQREARAEKLRKAREIELDLRAIDDDPQVKALRARRDELRSAASSALHEAETGLASARQSAESSRDHVGRLEAEVAIGEADAKDLEAAIAALEQAGKVVEEAEAKLAAARRDAERSERMAEIVEERMKAEERKAEARRHIEGERLLREAILRAKGLTAAASE